MIIKAMQGISAILILMMKKFRQINSSYNKSFTNFSKGLFINNPYKLDQKTRPKKSLFFQKSVIIFFHIQNCLRTSNILFANIKNWINFSFQFFELYAHFKLSFHFLPLIFPFLSLAHALQYKPSENSSKSLSTNKSDKGLLFLSFIPHPAQ